MQTSPEQSSHSAERKSSLPQAQLLEIERKFNVPVERLFEAFATPEALKAWWWPKGLYSDHIEIDFREGGRYFINMKGYDLGGGGMTGEFEEIKKDERLVMTDQFADKNGRVISAKEAKMPGTWPEMIYITFDFYSINSRKSGVNLSQQGIPNEAQKDCVQGWSESFDKLEIYLSDRWT